MTHYPSSGRILFPGGDCVRTYTAPLDQVVAHRLQDVLPALQTLEQHVARGRHVAGFLAYESAAAFDPALQTHPHGALPLLWFGVYETAQSLPRPEPRPVQSPPLPWRPCLSEATYYDALARIRDHLAGGDSYQVNFTFPTEAAFDTDPETWFWERLAAQECRHGAYLDLGHHQIMSLSPELFFALDGTTLTTRPMKGTRPRGLAPQEDNALAAALAGSPKDRAENLMIVDMLRNDLGRICDLNSIQVPELFQAERYPTVWQMTSTVTGRSSASIPQILSALFPSASVTGAPKVETMKIIRALEREPRGVYCGAIGWWAPDRQAQFNVAIRTATRDAATGTARFHTGSGITWDSDPAGEYEECLQKTAVLHHVRPAFSILSAIRLDSDGIFLLDRHLDRLAASAAYFGFPFDRQAVRDALTAYAATIGTPPAKLRIALDRHGKPTFTHDVLSPPAPWRLGLARTPVDPRQPWLFHKTTHRTVYDTAQATRPDCDAVLLWTSEGRITEANIANVVMRFGKHRYTPPVDDGLLDGVFRRYLLETGQIEERTLTLADLKRADEITLINSVRQWIPVTWVPDAGDAASLEDIR